MSPARRSFYFCKLYRFNPRGNWQQSQELNQYSRTLQHLAAKQLSFPNPSCSLKCYSVWACVLKELWDAGDNVTSVKSLWRPSDTNKMAQGRHWRWIWQIHRDVTNQLILSIKAKWSFHAQRQPTFEYQMLGVKECKDSLPVNMQRQ